MAQEQHKAEGTVAKLCKVGVLAVQGTTVAEGVRAAGVAETMYYRWRSKYEGLELELELERVKRLEQENGRWRT